MITDAKALFDSFHREGLSGNLVDKRTGLEILVLKERPQRHLPLDVFRETVRGQSDKDWDETALG